MRLCSRRLALLRFPAMLDIVELKFANGRGISAGEYIEADATRGDRRKDVDLLVADCLGSDDCLPGSSSPDIDGVLLYALAGVEPLHGERSVEGNGLGEADF